MITVLMSTYNGERHLREQLDSIVAQNGVEPPSIIVRDDGSSDGTIAILDDYKSRGLLMWYQGDNVGPARSFMQLLSEAPDSDYYAFSDQDDLWLPEKLQVACDKLSEMAGNKPSLYIGQTQPANSNLSPMAFKAQNPRCTFGEAVVHPYASGCTMMMNRKLRDIVISYTPQYIYMHDWWIVVIATAIGADIVYDAHPHMLYRQHETNVIGSNDSLCTEWGRRLTRMRSTQRHSRSLMAAELKEGFYQLMSRENRDMLDRFLTGRHSLRQRMLLLADRRFRPDGLKNYIFFKLAVLLNTY